MLDILAKEKPMGKEHTPIGFKKTDFKGNGPMEN